MQLTFSTPKYEGNAVPALVLDEHGSHGVGALGGAWNSVFTLFTPLSVHILLFSDLDFY